MAIVNKRLTGSQDNVVVVPSGKRYAITNILVCNNSSSGSQAFDIHLIANTGGTPGTLDDNVTRVVNNLDLPAGETFTFDSEKVILEAGDMLSFVGNSDLATTVSYLEV
jgi:hypothetical protein